MTYSLGVDLGTTTTAAAVRRGAHLEACPLGDLGVTIPSVALARPDGSVLVGEAADRAREGTALVASHIATRLDDPEPVALDGRPCDPGQLTGALLETVVDRVRRLHGDPPEHTVLTYPLFPDTGAAAQLERVGTDTLGDVQLVPHPIAAMAKLAHDVDIPVGRTVAVLDFGGRTFEVTLVQRTARGFDLVGEPGGLADLGGVDIDEAVFARVDAALGHVSHTIQPDDEIGMAELRRLRASCRAAKEQLSSSPTATIDVSLPGLATQVAVRRDELEDDIREPVAAAVDRAAETIRGAGSAVTEMHAALLVGGSSRLPLFGAQVADRLGLTILAGPSPELTVALGAALFGDDRADPAPEPVAPSEPVMPSGPVTAPSPMTAPTPALDSEDKASDVGVLAASSGDEGAHAAPEPVTPPSPITAATPPPAPDSGDQASDVGVLAAWFADPPSDGPVAATAMPQGPAGPPVVPAAGDDGADEPEEDGYQVGDEVPSDGWDDVSFDGWNEPGDTALGDQPGPPEPDADPVGILTPTRIGELTTQETDVWPSGPELRQRRSQWSGDRPDEDRDVDSAAVGPSGRMLGDGTDNRVILGVIGVALAIMVIAGVALVSEVTGTDDGQSLAPTAPARPASSTVTSTGTNASTTTSPSSTATTSSTTTTTDPRPEQEQPAPPPSRAPTTAAPTTTTTAPTTSAPPPTTAPSTTTSSTTSTTDCPIPLNLCG